MAMRDLRTAIALRRRSGPRACLPGWWRISAYPAAVFAVHQLCYLLAYGSGAGSELAAHGDQYVSAAAAVAVALVAVSVGLGLLRLFTAWRGRNPRGRDSLPAWLVWLGSTLALVAGLCLLEGLEIVFEPHHIGGVVGVFGSGGWWALPAAAFVAGVITLLARGGHALLALAARGRSVSRVDAADSRWWSVSERPSLRGRMSSCAAGRAPPLNASV